MKITEESIKCENCGKVFNSEEAFDMHNKAKHSEKVQKEKKPFQIKRIKNWTFFLLILGLIIWGIYSLMTSSNSFDALPASEINIGSHKNIALHIHSGLEIKINGEEFPIPANIGIQTGIMRPLHTHDSTGEIHIEGPYTRDFTIGEFFDIWNKTFNSACIFEYCTKAGNASELKMLVNGQRNTQFEDYTMRDSDEIIIEYKSFS